MKQIIQIEVDSTLDRVRMKVERWRVDPIGHRQTKCESTVRGPYTSVLIDAVMAVARREVILAADAPAHEE